MSKKFTAFCDLLEKECQGYYTEDIMGFFPYSTRCYIRYPHKYIRCEYKRLPICIQITYYTESDASLANFGNEAQMYLCAVFMMNAVDRIGYTAFIFMTANFETTIKDVLEEIHKTIDAELEKEQEENDYIHQELCKVQNCRQT
jgi:hypothetical protein